MIYAAALALGVFLAAPHIGTVGKPAAAPASEVHKSQTSVQRKSQPVANESPPAVVGEPRPPQIYAGTGVTLEAFRHGDAFAGYAVVRSHDPRLAVDDVITAVNGVPVEDTAAGSELLVAALRDPGAELAVQSRTDWASAD